MNPELIAAEIVDKLPELARDSKLNAHEFIAGKLRQAMTEESRMKSNGMSSMADRMVRLAMSNHTPEELALGYLRYEAIRRMSPRTFGEIHRLNLSGRIFDDLVDEALKAWKWPQEPND